MSILLLENYIKYILKENKEFIKKLHIFDFDATMYDSESNTWIESVVSIAKSSIEDQSTLAILCTARIKKPDVINETSGLLRDKGLYFENKFFMPENFNGSTPEYKTKTIQNILDKNLHINEVSFWGFNKSI